MGVGGTTTCGSGSGAIQHLEVRGWEGEDNEEDATNETEQQQPEGRAREEHIILDAKGKSEL